MKLKNILFITSFFPVIIFKVAAQVGGPTFAQAQIATVIGLILAGIPDSFLPIQSGIPHGLRKEEDAHTGRVRCEE